MEALSVVVIIIVFVFVIRLFGAWMLRIDEVISNQKQILTELKKANEEKK
jgi:hypothetical protein